MAALIILGLGPGDTTLLTRAAWDLLQTINTLYLRTAIHPTVAGLPAHIQLRSFDQLYESADSFDVLYDQIAKELIERVDKDEQVVYAVPGHPLVAEATSRRLLARAREHQLEVQIIPGLSFIEPVFSALGIDPLEQGTQLIDALDLVVEQLDTGPAASCPDTTQNAKAGAWAEIQGIGPYTPALIPFPLLPTRPALICQLYNRRIASHVKLSLLERYPATHVVKLVRAAGSEQEVVWELPLHELDRQDQLDHLTCMYVPSLSPLSDLRGPDGISYVVARLLGPSGCPWDREQTHQSLRSELLEEAHETLEALDAGDMEGLAEELGDLMLQVLMHSEMARQAGLFDLGHVYEQIAAKLIRRHPHVFGTLAVSGSEEVLSNWEAIKQAERSAKGQAPRGPLAGIPRGLPALATSQELLRKAVKAAVFWREPADIWDKLTALRGAAANGEDAQHAEEQLGEVLFAVAALARELHIDAESALRGANTRFREHVEQRIGDTI